VVASELVARKKFVYLCTNALLMERKLDNFRPSPYFAWAVHIDGLRERHDDSVEREGTFDKAVAAVRAAQAKGFRVTTNTTFFTHDSPKTVRDVLDFLNDELGVDEMMISPAYAYEKAPDREHFLGVTQTRKLFREAFADGRRKRWRLNHSPLFLDFLEGKAEFECTAWGIASGRLLERAHVPPAQPLGEQRRDPKRERGDHLDCLQDDAVGEPGARAHAVGGEHDQAGSLEDADVRRGRRQHGRDVHGQQD